jgi:hypothetical protein
MMHNIQYSLENVLISLVTDPNVFFFFTLAIICPIISSSKSHFVQPNAVCPAPAVPAVQTFWNPAHSPRIIQRSQPPDQIWSRYKVFYLRKKSNVIYIWLVHKITSICFLAMGSFLSFIKFSNFCHTRIFCTIVIDSHDTNKILESFKDI